MPDPALAQQMVDTQLRRRGITNERVLAAMAAVPRHRFASFDSNASAYGDHAFGIDCEQTISQPYIVALMSEALEVTPNARVLEIGTGSGYQTAVLAELGATVTTIERHGHLSQQAQHLLDELGYTRQGHIQFVVGNGANCYPEQAPYDRIIVTAATEHYPQSLVDQLCDDGGIMVYPKGPANGAQTLYKLVKRNGGLNQIDLGSVRFVPLVGHNG
ncbi:MAG: protein-L-isoaspartate(D-aspartate) O-methyltransferase [Cyanobacteria bacterium HKST-UBA06]|nr:protein-L-isoaspartate(D-aspartate) O-methyltransferase [Cyanobacteria bacterium HKST-UBA06]